MTVSEVAVATGAPRSTIGDACKRLGREGRRGKRPRPVRRPEPTRPVGGLAAELSVLATRGQLGEDDVFEALSEMSPTKRRAVAKALLGGVLMALDLPERELDLVTVAPAKVPDTSGLKGVRGEAGPGRGKPNPEALPGRESGSKPQGHATEERLRAIAERAPEPARELYRG
jgi:hypothetical protein